MSEAPSSGPRRKLSEKSKELLKRHAQYVEGRLEEEFQRPIEMHKEAEIALAKLPPWPAILALLLGSIMALIAIPSAFSYHRYNWERQQWQLSALQTPEELENCRIGPKWSAVTVMLPFAVIVVGLTVWGRRHRFAYLGFGLFGLALLETALIDALCASQNVERREAMVTELRNRLSESKASASRSQAEEGAVDDEQGLALAELRYRLETEQQERRLADHEATLKTIRERLRVDREAAAKAERVRQAQEAERKVIEARQQEEEARRREKEAQRQEEEAQRRKEEEQRRAREANERATVELAHAQEVREKQLGDAQERMDQLNASRAETLKLKEGLLRDIAEREAQIEARAAQYDLLLEEGKAQEEVLRAAEQIIDGANARRAELLKQKKTNPKALKKAEDTAKAAAQLKSDTQKELREIKSKANALQAESRKQGNEIGKLKGEVAKAETSLKEFDAQIHRARIAIIDLKN